MRNESCTYIWEVLFLVWLFYSLVCIISPGIGTQGKILHPFFPNISAAANLALSRNWHLPDIHNRIICTLSKVLISGIFMEISEEVLAALCTIREMGGWGLGAGLQWLVERGGPWPPWVLSCQYVFLEVHSYLGSLWDPGIHIESNDKQSSQDGKYDFLMFNLGCRKT